ncbi:hypothetical protein COCCADRAFT_81434, partial [Bipolaris zeicola 26-R-13]
HHGLADEAQPRHSIYIYPTSHRRSYRLSGCDPRSQFTLESWNPTHRKREAFSEAERTVAYR